MVLDLSVECKLIHSHRKIEESRQQMLMIDRVCPFNSIFEMQQFASAIAKNRAAPPVINWSDDYSKLTVRGQCIKLDSVRAGLQEMESKAWEILDDITLKERIPYNIPKDMVDDMTDSSIGYSWLDNGPFTESENALLQKLMQDPASKLGYKENGKLKCNMVAAVGLMDKLAEVNRLLSVLLHIAPSQPARGTEHVDQKIRNSWRLRNLFHQDGKLWMVTQYTKTTNLTGRDVFIPMIVPDRLAKLLEYYLVVFRPLETTLAGIIYGKDAAQLYHDYLYVERGERVSSKDFGQYFTTITAQYMNVPLLMSYYRHAAIAIKREFIDAIYHITSTHDDEVGDLLSGHSTPTARRIYATKYGDLPFLTTDAIREYINFCMRWHQVMGYGDGPIPLPLQMLRKVADSDGKLDVAFLRETIYSTVRESVRDEIKEVVREELQNLASSIGASFLPKRNIETLHVIGSSLPLKRSAESDEERDVKRLRIWKKEPLQDNIPSNSLPLKRSMESSVEINFKRSRTQEPSLLEFKKQKPCLPPFRVLQRRNNSQRTQNSQNPSLPPFRILERPKNSQKAQNSQNFVIWNRGKEPAPAPSHQPEYVENIDVQVQDSSQPVAINLEYVSPVKPKLRPQTPPTPSPPVPTNKSSVHALPPYFGSQPVSATPQKPLVNPLSALRKCYKNPSMEFKSDEQKELIQLVLERTHDVIAVMPTGGGKSAAFEVPAATEVRFQTVVVVPFVSIARDILQRNAKLGIPTCQWNAKMDWPSVRKAKLVLVVYESAASKKFEE